MELRDFRVYSYMKRSGDPLGARYRTPSDSTKDTVLSKRTLNDVEPL